MFSKEWEDPFSGLIQVALPRSLFDHCPIKLFFRSVDWGPKPFRFENAWLVHSEFIQMAKDCWTRTDVQGFAGFRIFTKFQVLKGRIRDWRCEVFDNIDSKKDSLLMELEE